MVLAPPLIPPRLSSLDLWDIGFASVYLQSFHKPDPKSAKKDKTKSRKAAGRQEKKKKKKTSKRGGGGNILCKSPREGLLAADFLRPDKAVDRDGDGPVHVLRGTVLGEPHLAKGFADPHDGFEVADLHLAISLIGSSRRTRRRWGEREEGRTKEGGLQ